jgi:3-hydroxyacyl-CoA dehydrogenase
LVEVVAGAKTSPDAIQRAMRFYTEIGKKPILLKKELPGHVANRLQIALYKEVLYLLEQDVLSVADADAAVSWGPGLRWGIMGPNLQFHLAGGAGGMKHFFEGVFEGLLPMFKTLGNPTITPELKAKVTEGVLQEAGDRSIEQIAQDENQKLVALLRLRADGSTAARAEEKIATRRAS